MKFCILVHCKALKFLEAQFMHPLLEIIIFIPGIEVLI